MTIPTPSFFIIGAQKAGTTTLHHWLSDQSGICLPGRKETHFFSHDERYALGLGWYINQFNGNGGGRIYGEIDPDYLFFPAAASRIKALGLWPKFVVIVREPLARAYSHYRMSVRRGLERLTFDEALTAEAERLADGNSHHLRHHSYMARGRYVEQIERFRNLFSSDSLLIFTFEDLFGKSTCDRTFGRLCAFLGIEAPRTPVLQDKKFNPAGAPRSRMLNTLLWDKRKWAGARKVVRQLIPLRDLKYRIVHQLDNANQKPVETDKGWRSRISSTFIQQAGVEAERLAAATGLDLNVWKSN